MKTEFNSNYISIFSSYRAVNTFRSGFTQGVACNWKRNGWEFSTV